MTDTNQGHNEALALVNVHKTPGSPQPGNSPASGETDGVSQGKKPEDLRRAKELVQLHHEMKSTHVNGEVDDDLRRAREDVRRVLRELS